MQISYRRTDIDARFTLLIIAMKGEGAIALARRSESERTKDRNGEVHPVCFRDSSRLDAPRNV